MALLIRLAWRSIWRNKRRTIITVASISFSLALAVFFISFGDGMYAKLIDDAVRMQAGHITVENAEYQEAPAIDLVVDAVQQHRGWIERIDGVERTKAMVVGQGVARSGQGSLGVALVGVEPAVEVGSSPLARKLVAGSYLDGTGEAAVVVGAKLAERLKLESEKELQAQLARLHPLVRWSGLERKRLAQTVRMHLAVGKKMVIASNNIDGKMVEELVRVKGVFQTGAVEIDGFFVQVPIDFARKLYGMQADQATQVGVLVSDIDQRDAIQALIQERIGRSVQGLDKRLAVLGWEQVLPDLAAYIKIDGGSNYIFQGILIFLVMFTIFNTILMSVLERRREFAVLLALGTPAVRLKAQILFETILISLIGVGLGLLIGGLGAYALQVHGLDLTHLYDESISVSGIAVDPIIYALVTPGLLASVGAIVFGCTLLLSLYPMKRIDRIPVADVLR